MRLLWAWALSLYLYELPKAAMAVCQDKRFAAFGSSYESYASSGKSQLPPTFIHRHGDRVGQVQAPTTLAHRQTQALIAGKGVEYVSGQAATFRAEQEGVALLKAGVVEGA